MVKNMPITVGIRMVMTWFQLFALNEPMVQVIIFIASSWWASIINEIKLESTVLITTPVSKSENVSTPLFVFEMKYTSMLVNIALRKAAKLTMELPSSIIGGKNMIAMVAPKAAPDDIPITYGSAMGF